MASRHLTHGVLMTTQVIFLRDPSSVDELDTSRLVADLELMLHGQPPAKIMSPPSGAVARWIGDVFAQLPSSIEARYTEVLSLAHWADALPLYQASLLDDPSLTDERFVRENINPWKKRPDHDIRNARQQLYKLLREAVHDVRSAIEQGTERPLLVISGGSVDVIAEALRCHPGGNMSNDVITGILEHICDDDVFLRWYEYRRLLLKGGWLLDGETRRFYTES